MKRAPRLKEVVLRGSFRKSGFQERKILILECPSIRFLNIKELGGVEEIEVRQEGGNVIVVKGNKKINVQIKSCD